MNVISMCGMAWDSKKKKKKRQRNIHVNEL